MNRGVKLSQTCGTNLAAASTFIPEENSHQTVQIRNSNSKRKRPALKVKVAKSIKNKRVKFESESSDKCANCRCLYQGYPYTGIDWLCCTKCSYWYCGECVGIDSNSFMCQSCTAVHGNVNETELICEGSDTDRDCE